MSIVQAAAEMHRAQIELGSSTDLGGLRVVVCFPRAPESGVDDTAHAAS
jgi:signal transduction histidine kinase